MVGCGDGIHLALHFPKLCFFMVFIQIAGGKQEESHPPIYADTAPSYSLQSTGNAASSVQDLSGDELSVNLRTRR
jgi:hypothetical protein